MRAMPGFRNILLHRKMEKDSFFENILINKTIILPRSKMATRSFFCVDLVDLNGLPPPLSEETALKEKGLWRKEISFPTDVATEELKRSIKRY